MKIGFTGTKDGMTDAQKLKFDLFITSLSPTEFHHGSCVGADDEAGIIVKKNKPNCQIVLHPPIKTTLKADSYFDVSREPKDYLVRNKDIVNESDVLIATPKEHNEQLRSGTWSTIRYAQKINKPLICIFPDGTYKCEGFK